MNNSNNPHFKKYHDFLISHRVERGAKFTHTSLNNPLGSFSIDEKDHTKFFRLYRNALDSNAALHLTEKHKSYGPIVVDIDMKYSNTTLLPNRIYSNVLIELVRIYVNVIDKYLVVKDEDFMAFVFEKNKPTEKETEFKDGIHIMFPHICAINQLQHIMRKDFINQVNALNLFDKLPLSNEIDDIVDKIIVFI